MRIFDRFKNNIPIQESDQNRIIETLSSQIEILRESTTRLNDLVPQGWDVVYGSEFKGKRELDRSALDTLANQARLYYFKNPLIKRTCQIQSLYTWAKGITIKADDDQVNTVLQRFLMDPKNIPALTGHQAQMQLDTEISLHGNLFIAFFTDSYTGRVVCRTIPFDEIREIIPDEGDMKTPQYYLRQHLVNGKSERVLLPDIKYKPKEELPEVKGIKIDWDVSIFHVKTNCLSDMLWGVPEVWAALDYANAYRDFLQDWSKFVKALSKFAWQAKTKGGQSAVTALARGLEQRLNPGGGTEPTRPGQVAGVLTTNENITMEPVKVAGASVAVDDARRLMLMVASATGISETYLSGDASVGNYATSKTMERPLEMQIRNRQELWSYIYGEILNQVIDKAATAINGPLKGIANVITDEYGEQKITLKGSEDEDDISRTVDISFPPVLDSDPSGDIQALIAGATLNGQPLAGTIDLKTIASQVCRILDINNAEKILSQLFPEGTPLILQTQQQATQAQAAANQAALLQQMNQDEEEEPEEEKPIDKLVKEALKEAGIEYKKLYASA